MKKLRAAGRPLKRDENKDRKRASNDAKQCKSEDREIEKMSEKIARNVETSGRRIVRIERGIARNEETSSRKTDKNVEMCDKITVRNEKTSGRIGDRGGGRRFAKTVVSVEIIGEREGRTSQIIEKEDAPFDIELMKQKHFFLFKLNSTGRDNIRYLLQTFKSLKLLMNGVESF